MPLFVKLEESIRHANAEACTEKRLLEGQLKSKSEENEKLKEEFSTPGPSTANEGTPPSHPPMPKRTALPRTSHHTRKPLPRQVKGHAVRDVNGGLDRNKGDGEYINWMRDLHRMRGVLLAVMMALIK